MKHLKRLLRVPLPLLCYAAVLLVWLAACTLGFAGDRLAQSSGILQQQSLQMADFTPVALEALPDGSWLTTTDDPQLLWQNTEIKLRSFRYKAHFSGDGHEMCLYYKNPGDLDFSQHKRVWPVQQPDGSYLFTLPNTPVESLRLDPVSVQGLQIEFEGFWLNEPQPTAAYYNPGAWGLAWLLAGPAMLAAGLRWLLDVWLHYTAKRTHKAGRARHKEG